MAEENAHELAEKALQVVLNQINGVKGKTRPSTLKIGKLGDIKCIRTPVISTGSLALNKALGVGGIARGRMIEIYGPEASGKTTLALEVIAECQKCGGTAAFIDAEHALDMTYAKVLGVTEDLLISQPDSGDEALEIVDQLARSGLVRLVVVDSVAALVTRAELEGEVTDTHMGRLARLMSQALRRFAGICAKANTTLIFINQTRANLSPYASPTTTPGGNALKFYASQRIEVARKEPLKDGEEVYGALTRAKVIKNKVAPPFKTAFFNIIFGKGIDKTADLISVAIEDNIVEKSGAWFKYQGETIAQGIEGAVEYFKNNPDKFEEIKKKVMDSIFANQEEEEVADEG